MGQQEPQTGRSGPLEGLGGLVLIVVVVAVAVALAVAVPAALCMALLVRILG